MSWCRSPWVILFDTLCTFWTFRSVSFAWLMRFQSLFLKIGFLLLSLSLSSGTSYSDYAWCFARGHMDYPHFCYCCYFFFISFTVFGWFPLACLPDRWSFLLHHIILCWLPLLFLLLIIILFLSLDWFFMYVCVCVGVCVCFLSLLNFSLCSSNLLLSSLSIFMTINLNLFSRSFLISVFI